jgi:hydrogenase expression/formation protein HypE
MRNDQYGSEAAIIGKVDKTVPGKVVLKTTIGGERIVDLPTVESVPGIG